MSKYNIIDVVPHGAPMSLLDEIIRYTDTGLVARVTIRPDSLFVEEQGVPAWIGIEYMGQAIAAFAGVQARESNQPVKIGFLVSTRKYTSPCSHFSVGTVLDVSVEQVTDNMVGLSVFSCQLSGTNIDIQANLNVFMPENVNEFLEGNSNG